MINVVLIEPEIPQNTGNIARTCAATGCRLHLVHPLGFDISEKAVRHAGLDYWKDVEIIEWKTKEAFFEENGDRNLFLFSTKARTTYSDVDYNMESEEVFLLFGKESRGIDEDILIRYKDRVVRIPMLERIRSLNLSNSVAIAVYEALRQNGFPSFEKQGELHGKLRWEDTV